MVVERAGLRGGGSGRGFTFGALLALLVALALVAAACGGGSSDKKADEAYANSVCTAIGSWQKQVKSILTSFSGIPSKTGLQTKVTQVEAATKMLATQIKAVPAPNTSDGQAAKQQLDQLSTDVTTTISSAKTAVAQIPSGASAGQIAVALIPLKPQVQTLLTSAQSAISSLQNRSGSLGSAFKSTASCQSLVGG